MSIFLKKSLAVYFSTYSSEEFKSGSDNSNVIWVAMNFIFIAVSYSWHVKSQVPMSTLEKKKKKIANATLHLHMRGALLPCSNLIQIKNITCAHAT